jgi:hypothetical protein
MAMLYGEFFVYQLAPAHAIWSPDVYDTDMYKKITMNIYHRRDNEVGSMSSTNEPIILP